MNAASMTQTLLLSTLGACGPVSASSGGGATDFAGDEAPCAAGQVPCGRACCRSAPLAAGDAHSCAIDAAGAVVCWGWNADGQLGDGTRADRAVPVKVRGLSSGVVALAAGVIHTCALKTSGTVVCWGGGSDGQLGDGGPLGATEHSETPISVVGLGSDVVAIAASTYTTCAVTAAGRVACWGPTAAPGATADAASSTAVVVPGLTGVVALTAGAGYFCATTPSGPTCWGTTHFGAFGDGSTVVVNGPPARALSSLGSPAALSANDRSACAITTSGAAACWGDDTYGQLGNSALARWDGSLSTTPVPVDGLGAGAIGLSVGSQALHVCAWTRSVLRCWGFNSDGQAGRPTTDASMDVVALPRAVPLPSSDISYVAAGGEHTCARAGGHVYCWGSNEVGQLGAGGDDDGSVAALRVAGL
jgi:alpha-tubulin suppressor-like RCC1 family protein